jgi:hypothetical protein
MGYLLKDKCEGGFFYKPQWLYDGGLVPKLSLSERALLDFFFHVVNRTGSPVFLVSESVIEDKTGLTRKTIRAAREGLRKERLIGCKRTGSAGAPYVFILFNPETQQPFPHDGKAPAVYDPERRKKVRAVQDDLQKVVDQAVRPSASALAFKPIPRPNPEPKIPGPKSQQQDSSKGLGVRPEEERKPDQLCRLCGTSSVWYLPDGTPRCRNCHPNPQKPYSNVPTRSEVFGR